MLLKIITLQICAHLLSDFIFQSDNMSKRKEEKVLKYHLFHFLIVLGFSYVCSFDFGFWKAAMVISVVHFGIDVLKSWGNLKKHLRYSFFIDQILHILVLIIISYAYSELYDINLVFYFKAKHLAIIVGFVICTKPANILINEILLIFNIKSNKEDSNENKTTESENSNNSSGIPNAGKIIGITERLLALGLILMGQYEAVGLIIAAKSILRFEGMRKSEYILVGTLLSFATAIFTGIIINLA